MGSVQHALIMLLLTSFVAREADKYEPKPYSLGNGDTLMVRTVGYGFCPEHCEVDHFHTGHKKHYNCETTICNHIIYEDGFN